MANNGGYPRVGISIDALSIACNMEYAESEVALTWLLHSNLLQCPIIAVLPSQLMHWCRPCYALKPRSRDAAFSAPCDAMRV